MNAVAHAQLTFQMLTLLQKYLPMSHEAMRQGMVALGRVVLDEGTNAPEAQHKFSWVCMDELYFSNASFSKGKNNISKFSMVFKTAKVPQSFTTKTWEGPSKLCTCWSSCPAKIPEGLVKKYIVERHRSDTFW